MTNEEAIRILARDTSLEAVNELKYYAGFCSDKVIEQIQEAMDMGAEALKKQSRIIEKLEAEKTKLAKVEYCSSKGDCSGKECFVCCAEHLIEIVKAGGTE